MKQKLNSCLLSNNLEQMVKCPTRISEHSKTIIDLICVNMEHKVVQSEVLGSHLSDNSIVLSVLKGGVPKLPPRFHESRSFKNYCKESFVNDLNNVPWPSMRLPRLMMQCPFGSACFVVLLIVMLP